jgi:hypothetical protein
MFKLNVRIGMVAIILGCVSGVCQEFEARSPDALISTSNSMTAAEKSSSLSSGFVERVYEGTSKVEGAALARRKIIEEATFKVSEEIAQGILGEARYKKNKNVIVDKVFRQASRYVPVIKAGELLAVPEGQKLSVTLQVNTKVLETLLQQQGVLFDNESAPMMIPFIAIDDQTKAESFRWWRAQNPVNLAPMAEFLESQLQKVLFAQGFYVQRPGASRMHLMVPKAFQQDLLTPEQIQALAGRWGIPLALIGDLTFNQNAGGEFVIELHLSVNQIGTGRNLAQLYRQSKLGRKENLENLNFKKSLAFVVEAYKDLGQQMLEAWQRGVLTSTLVRLEVQGALPLSKYELFKDALKVANRSIRQVRERLITSQSVLFELEISGATGDISAGLGQIVAGDQTYKLKSVEAGNTFIMVPVGAH